MRTLSEILIDVDNTESIKEISNLDDEFFKNKKKYTLVELSYFNEHVECRVREIARKDSRKINNFINGL